MYLIEKKRRYNLPKEHIANFCLLLKYLKNLKMIGAQERDKNTRADEKHKRNEPFATLKLLRLLL